MELGRVRRMTTEEIVAYTRQLIEARIISPLPIDRFFPTEAWEGRDAHSMSFQNMTEEAEKEMAEWRGIIDGGRKGRK